MLSDNVCSCHLPIFSLQSSNLCDVLETVTYLSRTQKKYLKNLMSHLILMYSTKNQMLSQSTCIHKQMEEDLFHLLLSVWSIENFPNSCSNEARY